MTIYDRTGGASGDRLESASQAPIPAVPASRSVRYVSRFAGVDVPWVVTSDGVRTPDLSSLRRGTRYAVMPAGVGTAVVPSATNGGVVVGYAAAEVVSGGGTVSHPALTFPGTAATSARRTLMTSSATDNQVMSILTATAGPVLRTIAQRSSTARLGGWFSWQSWACPGSSVANGTFNFGGLASAYFTLNDCFGIGWFTTDTTGVYIKTRAGSTTTSVALDGTLADAYDSNGTGAATFPELTRALVQAGRISLYTACLPGNASWIGMRVVDELTGVVHYEGRRDSGNLPTVNTGLGQDTELGTGAVGNESGAVILADYGREIWVSPAAAV